MWLNSDCFKKIFDNKAKMKVANIIKNSIPNVQNFLSKKILFHIFNIFPILHISRRALSSAWRETDIFKPPRRSRLRRTSCTLQGGIDDGNEENGISRRALLDQKGRSILVIILIIGICICLFFLVSPFYTEILAQKRKYDIRNNLSEQKQKYLSMFESEEVWKNTLFEKPFPNSKLYLPREKNQTSFDCLINPKNPCTGKPWDLKTPDEFIFQLYGDNDLETNNKSNPVPPLVNPKKIGGSENGLLHGIDYEGRPCNSFNPGKGMGNDLCPFQIQTSWKRLCKETCDEPLAQIKVKFIYNPKTSIGLNFSNEKFNIIFEKSFPKNYFQEMSPEKYLSYKEILAAPSPEALSKGKIVTKYLNAEGIEQRLPPNSYMVETEIKRTITLEQTSALVLKARVEAYYNRWHPLGTPDIYFPYPVPDPLDNPSDSFHIEGLLFIDKKACMFEKTPKEGEGRFAFLFISCTGLLTPGFHEILLINRGLVNKIAPKQGANYYPRTELSNLDIRIYKNENSKSDNRENTNEELDEEEEDLTKNNLEETSSSPASSGK